MRAREVPVAELGGLEGELVAVAALRPGEQPDEPVATAEPAAGSDLDLNDPDAPEIDGELDPEAAAAGLDHTVSWLSKSAKTRQFPSMA